MKPTKIQTSVEITAGISLLISIYIKKIINTFISDSDYYDICEAVNASQSLKLIFVLTDIYIYI